MKICTSPEFENKNNCPVTAALGTFDGLHLGHQAVINKTISLATKNNTTSGVYTFHPHPRKIITSTKTPALLLSDNQKKKILQDMGVDYYFQQDFTPDFSQMSFEKFISDILLAKLNIKHVVVGYNFHFGHRGKGNTKSLRKLGDKFGFKVTVVDPVKVNNKTISSTLIRNKIENGDLNNVNLFLGHLYKIAGKVIHGDKRGGTFGIPTANIDPETDYVLPPAGVYAAYCFPEGKKYPAVANLGFNPTFNGNRYSIEVHIFDYSNDLYGQRLEFAPVEFIRREKTFANVEKLIKQIEKDILYTKKVLC